VGLLDRFRRKKEEASKVPEDVQRKISEAKHRGVTEYWNKKEGNEVPGGAEHWMVGAGEESGEEKLKEKLAEHRGEGVKEFVEEEEVPVEPEKEPALERFKVSPEEVKGEEKEEAGEKKSGVLKAAVGVLDKRNWSDRLVSEVAFASYKEAQQYAKNMRRAGYTAKVVRMSDGTYKVYVYRKGGGDPLSKLNKGLKLKGLKSANFNKALGKNALKSMNMGRGTSKSIRFTMPQLTMGDFNLNLDNLRSIDLGLDEFNLAGLEGLKSFDFDLGLSGGGAYGSKAKKARKKKARRRKR